MFDDQTNNQAAPPSNLPTEPEDMFAGVDNNNSVPVPPPPKALDVGLLKKKMPSEFATPAVPSTPVTSPTSPAPATKQPFTQVAPASPATPAVSAIPPAYSMKEPILGKIILFVLFGAILAGMAYGGWWAYNNFVKNPASEIATEGGTQSTAVTTSVTDTVTEPIAQTTTQAVDQGVSNNTNISAEMNNDKILMGEPIDTDKDGLDDIREKELGTKADNADSDDDGLNDGEEVIIFKTNPLNPDTDNDGYVDGKEVRNGYNPLGAGKLNIIPVAATSTASTVTTTTTGTNK